MMREKVFDPFDDTREDLIDEAIAHIECAFVEYTNGSKTQFQAQDWQRYIIRDLIEQLEKLSE